MRLVEKEYCWIVKDVFSANILTGFTKPAIEGFLPQDIRKLSADIGRDFNLAYLDQLHSAKVNFIEKPGIYEGDALFSRQENYLLAVRTADCLPLFFHRADTGVIGVVHMGWRGAAAGILNNIGGDLSGYKAAAGVGLRRCCYQVGAELCSHARLRPFIKQEKGSFYFDVLGFTKAVLSSSGIGGGSFFDLGFCSYCGPAGFPSWRRHPSPARTVSFIMRG